MITEVFYCTTEYALSLPENDGVHSQRLVDRLAKVTNAEVRRESVAAETLLRAVTGMTAPLDLVEEEHGKPRFRAGYPLFNLTHTDGFVACAVGSPCGVDAEKTSERLLRLEPLLNAAEKDFAGVDLAKTAFVWTAKEAFCKFTGEGFRQLKKTSVGNFSMQKDGFTADCSACGTYAPAFGICAGDVVLTVVCRCPPRFIPLEL